eukprot:13006059-Ditylum_brightwellii.AAC.1
MATDIVLGKSFSFDTLHMQRTNEACTDFNAKACYDHMLPIVLSLVYCKVGLPYDTFVVFASLLYNMQFYITTAFGVAAQANFFGLIGPVLGIGQDAIDEPLGWLCTADIVLKCYEYLAKGCIMQDPMQTIVQKANSAMFVDDAFHHHNGTNKNIPPKHLMQNICTDNEIWGRLI